MNEKPADNEDYHLVKQHTQNLMEHFESVQIFVTRCEPDRDGTVHVAYGQGNFFARLGHIDAWLVKEKEFLRIDARKADES